MFPREVIEQIGIYIYGLKDPRTDRYFYIGKGQGNRVYDHLALKDSGTESNPKINKIEEIRAAGHEPSFDIIRWGLSKKEESVAFAIEASIIDTLNVDQLSNLVRGHGKGSGFGMLSEREIKEKFQGADFSSSESFIAFKLNRLWTPNLSSEDLYQATRKMWRVSGRRDKADYALAVSFGIVRQVYRIDQFSPESRWERFTHDRDGTPLAKERWGFIGTVADDLQALVNTKVGHLLNATGQNPVFYINC